MSAYRRDDYADPVAFVTQLGAVLERYPADIVKHVTDPYTGLQRTLKFPPSIAEVVEACDAEVSRRANLARYRNMARRLPGSSPAARGGSTRTALLARFNVTDIPKSWTVIDLATAAHRYGPDLQKHIDEVIQAGGTNENQWSRTMEKFQRGA